MYFYQSPRTADHDLEWRINIPLSTHRIEIFATPALSAWLSHFNWIFQ